MQTEDKILNIPASDETTKCCSCDEVKCIHREFDGCEQCEIKAAFWLRRIERVVAPPFVTSGGSVILQASLPSCFV